VADVLGVVRAIMLDSEAIEVFSRAMVAELAMLSLWCAVGLFGVLFSAWNAHSRGIIRG